MEAKLVVIGGKANKSEVKLKLPAMIGRSRDADITVSHASVSRHHCLVYELEGALVVRDNGSLNGTVIDGERIHEALLKPGQSLTIGPLTFRADYQFEGAFPVLGAAPPGANGQAVDSQPRAASKSTESAAPEFSFAEEEPAAKPAHREPAHREPAHREPTAVESPLPDVSAEEEAVAGGSADGGFDFLDEEVAPSTTSSKPSFGFLKDADAGNSKAGDEDIDDSTAVFRIADEPQPAVAKAADKASKSPPPGKPAAKSAAAAAKGDDDAALDDFLNSLGLEE
jgi:hypothetical protein